jgi:hypothetical protein
MLSLAFLIPVFVIFSPIFSLINETSASFPIEQRYESGSARFYLTLIRIRIVNKLVIERNLLGNWWLVDTSSASKQNGQEFC